MRLGICPPGALLKHKFPAGNHDSTGRSELLGASARRIICNAHALMEMTMKLAHLEIAVAALSLAATPAYAQDKVRVQTDWIPSGEHAMYYGGWQKGIFAAEGI